MFDIIGFDIHLTRSDTAFFHVDILKDGDIYNLKDSDELILTVKKYATREKIYFQIKSDSNGNFTILPSTTKDMPFGDYEYDIQLTINPDEVYTIIPVSIFRILEEIS